MAADEPPYLTVGTDVSAKYKGAFCEAKIKKVNRVVKCKVTFKNNQGSVMVPDDQIRGSLRIGALVEARHPEKNQFFEAIINKMQDYSQYTVVFDDGDETTLRRTSLCLKSGRHFAESPTLDQFPLTNPEHFGTPVIGAVKSKRKRRSTYNSSTVDYSSSDEEVMPKKTKPPRRREKDPDIGKVVCVDYGDRRKKDSWYPGLVVPANSSQDTFKINTKEEYLIRSFKDGKYYQVPKKDTREFGRDVYRRVESNTLRIAIDKALLYSEKGELPAHWDKAMETASGEDDSHDTDTDTSDDEPSEEKDRFVAQLYKFMDERGTPINKAPTVGNKDINLYKLFKVVHKMGGYNRVTNQNKWKIVYTKMGLQSSNPSGSNQLKLAYKRFLHSFEDFYRKLGCTMVSNSRSTRGRHRSDRNFIITRNAASVKARARVKDKSAEKKIEEKPSVSDKKEKCKSESPKSDDVSRKRIDKAKTEEKETKVKVKKEEEKPRLVKSQSLTKDKREEEKKDTRTDRARAREESKREKTESPEKKKETRSSAKFDLEKREKDLIEKKSVDVKEAKDRFQKEKKIEKPVKDSKVGERKEDPPSKERKSDKRIVEKNKDAKLRGKTEEKKPEKDKDEEPKEKKADKVSIEPTRTEVRVFTRDKKEKLSLDKNDVLQLKGVRDEKSWSSLKITTDTDDEHLVKEKQNLRKIFPIDSEPSVILSEIKTEKDEGTDTECSPFAAKASIDIDYDDNNEDDIMKEGMKKRHEHDGPKSLHDLTDSEDDDDGSGSEKSEKDSKERQVEVGDKIKVKYGRGRTRKVYEAKVLKIDISTGEKRYFVHYTGWNVRYDEWVKRSFIVENMSEKNKFSRQKRPDSDKNSLTVIKKIDRSKPPGLASASKLTRKNSTSSTTSVSSSRTTRSDKNSNLHTSPFSKGLQPKKRTRRKSGVSTALTDTSQESESDEDDMLFLYPDGEMNDEEEMENDSQKRPSDVKKETESDLETEKETIISTSDEKPEQHLSLELMPVIKSDAMSAETPLMFGGKPVPFKSTGLTKFDCNFSERKVPCIFAKKIDIGEANITKLIDSDTKPVKLMVGEGNSYKHTKEKCVLEEVKKPDDSEVKPTEVLNVDKLGSDPISGKLKNESITDNSIVSEKPVGKTSGDDVKPLVKESIYTLQKVTDAVGEESVTKYEKPLSEPAKSSEVLEVAASKQDQLNEKMPPLMFMDSCDRKCAANKPVPDQKETMLSNVSPESQSSEPTLKLKKETVIADEVQSEIHAPNEVEQNNKHVDKGNTPLISENDPVSISNNSSINNSTTHLDPPQPAVERISCREHLDEKSPSEQQSSDPLESKLSEKIDNAESVETLPGKLEASFKEQDTKPTGEEIKPITTDSANDQLKISAEFDTNSNNKTTSEEPAVQEAPKTTPQADVVADQKSTTHQDVIRPSKISESEVTKSYPAFPLRHYFMDLGKPPVVEDSLGSKNEEKSVLEAKAVEKPDLVPEHEKEPFIPKFEICKSEKTSASYDLKDMGLQTSVIAFARSSTSSTCTSLTEPEDSSSHTETKDSDPLPRIPEKLETKPISPYNKSAFNEPRLQFLQNSPTKDLDILPQQDDSGNTSETSTKNEEKQENLCSPLKTEVSLDDSIHESLTELSIDDESQDINESDKAEKSHIIPPTVGNVFLNVSSDKSMKDTKDLFFPKNVSSINYLSCPKTDNLHETSDFKQPPSDVPNDDERTVIVCKDNEEIASPLSMSLLKKEGKKKKSKISKDKRGGNSDHEREESKTKESKGKSKKKKFLETDEFSKLKDSDQKIKNKKLKKNKNKKRLSKYEDTEAVDESKDITEKMRRKEKRKREEKKFSKFDMKSEGPSAFKGETSKKERKKGRKNKLGSDKKSEVGDKKVKKKKKVHTDDNIDTDSEKETVIRTSEKKKEKKKKMKPKDTSSSDDAADGKLLIDESNILEESQEKNDDPDMSFLLCEEKVPASPVNALPDDTTASSSIDDSNNVSPSSDEEQLQAVNLEMFPRSSNLDILNSVNKHNAEACAVLDNTPPTTPSSTGSISSSSPPRDREPFVHYTESTQSGRDSGDGDEDSFQCGASRTEVSESDEYCAATTLAFAVCKSVPEKPRDCSRGPLKRQKSESEDFSPLKRKRKSKRSLCTPETPVKSGHARVKGLSRYSKGEGCGVFDSPSVSAVGISSPPHGHSSTLFASFSHSSSQQVAVTSDASSTMLGKSSKVNFYIPLHEHKDPEKRIAILQDKMAELKKMYASLKAEVATIDRRRKKARKKMREAAASSANTSSTHSEDAQSHS